MDESIQQQIEKSLAEKPEHWEWDYGCVPHPAYLLNGTCCGYCRMRYPQSRAECIAHHSSEHDGGVPVLIDPPHARSTSK